MPCSIASSIPEATGQPPLDYPASCRRPEGGAFVALTPKKTAGIGKSRSAAVLLGKTRAETQKFAFSMSCRFDLAVRG